MKKEFQPQDFDYWFHRPKNDDRLDWRIGEINWIEGYIKSVSHPHRDLILEALKNFEWSYLLELGCNAGPNLFRIRQEYPEKALFGIDANPDAIQEARNNLEPNTELKIADLMEIPYPNQYFDIVLADAVLMYISDLNIRKALNEIDRVVKKGVILVEWDDKTLKGKVKDFHWSRNYKVLLEKLGFEVVKIKITKENWSTSKSWIKNGYIYIAQRA